MIALGLRLAVAGGREAATRLVVVALAVALGTGLLLATLAGINATKTQNLRYAWLNTGVAETTTAARPGVDPFWWLGRGSYFRGEELLRLDVAATGPATPVPPGIPALPGPGEFYVSPALHDLLRTTPAAQLGDRFPGREAGVIGDAALPSPDTLMVIAGQPPEVLAAQPQATQVSAILGGGPATCGRCIVGLDDTMFTISLSVIAAGLIFPVLIFIGTATRLSAARREQRFAAMRLIGATPRQVSLLATVESTVAAAAGALLGFGVFFAIRPGLAAIPFTGATFFPSDLTLTWVNVLAVVAGIPIGAAVAARLALRRVRISPLGVTRRVTPRPPRAWRLIPLVAGIAELAWFVGRKPETTDGQTYAYLAGVVLMVAGLVLAGPWLTMRAARLVAGRAQRPAALIAGRRLADDPMAAFRAVSGLVVALFVMTAASGAITSYVAERARPAADSVEATSLTQNFRADDLAPGSPVPSVSDIPADLSAIPGVRAVLAVKEGDQQRARDSAIPEGPGVIACADLAKVPEYGSCPPGARTVAVWNDLVGPREPGVLPHQRVWPVSTITDLDSRRLLSVVVQTDGSDAAKEQARTVLATMNPWAMLPATEAEFETDSARTLVQFQRLADVVILASLPIAGCSLAVSVIAGLTDRKRPFSVLRLTGVRIRMLRAVVALETVVPLVVVAAVAIGAGFLAATLFLRAQLDYPLHAPGGSYYAIVGGGLLASLGIIATTLPLLRRITGPETARNE
ncbi:FtsX-like permease family protein [Asanoa hainanensis]|uniref:FtsX-like permease family protein n=1 Tax=Asanoa hainanensis TaxID=560556 RepID=A0A239GZ63_9ACTN|nr:FtsX-like permease family protein [Asanoa hainanensis]SNS74155.1 FtsX-like permease family protein [Asanoa hainanensis]